MEALTTAFNSNPFLTGLPLPRPDILAPADLDQNTGTAQILRLPEVRELVKTDFLVLPCDLVCELAGEKLLQAWTVKSASLSNLLGNANLSNDCPSRHSGGLGVWYNTNATWMPAVKGEETDFFATAPLPQPPSAPPKGSLFPNLARLVYSIPTDSLNDLVEERKALPIRHSLLRSNPRVRMYASYRDAHIYIFPRWTLDFITANDRLDSIGEDVVGWLAKAGWQRGLAEKLHIRTSCQGEAAKNENGSLAQSPSSPPDGSPGGLSWLAKQTRSLAAVENQPMREQGGPSASAAEFEVPPIIAYVHAADDQAIPPLIRRVDTAQLLLATSLQLARLPSVEEAGPESASPFAHAKKVAYPEGVKARTTVTKQDSLLAENVTVEEKTSIKETVVGANCQIHEGAKLSQCLLMEGIVVGKGCKLSKCILGKRCVIGAGSVLTDCEVQENLMVEPQSEHGPVGIGAGRAI